MDSSGQISGAALPGLGGSLAISLLSLGVVCLLAYLGLKWLSRRGVGAARGPIRIVAKCPLEPRRSLYLVETAGRCFLLGVGDGPMTMLADLGVLDLAEGADSGRVAHIPRFSVALDRVLGRKPEVP